MCLLRHPLGQIGADTRDARLRLTGQSEATWAPRLEEPIRAVDLHHLQGHDQRRLVQGARVLGPYHFVFAL